MGGTFAYCHLGEGRRRRKTPQEAERERGKQKQTKRQTPDWKYHVQGTNRTKTKKNVKKPKNAAEGGGTSSKISMLFHVGTGRGLLKGETEKPIE